MANEEEYTQVREDYGFKANIRQKVYDTTIRIKFLESINIHYAVTIMRMLIFSFGAVIIAAGVFLYLTSDGTRAKYIGLPLVLIAISLIGFLAMFSLITPSYGSLLKSSVQLFLQTLERILIKLGFGNNSDYTGIAKVRKDGTILFYNGDYGVMFLVDGMTSATAYPSEIKAQEDNATRYHNGRNKTTAEVHLTSSQKQNTEQQMASLESLYKSTHNTAKHAILNHNHYYLKNEVNGVKPTIVQHLLLRDKSEARLKEHIERLMTFVSKDQFYYYINPLSEEKVEEVLGDFYKLK